MYPGHALVMDSGFAFAEAGQADRMLAEAADEAGALSAETLQGLVVACRRLCASLAPADELAASPFHSDGVIEGDVILSEDRAQLALALPAAALRYRMFLFFSVCPPLTLLLLQVQDVPAAGCQESWGEPAADP
jgi:hypothetical protein